MQLTPNAIAALATVAIPGLDVCHAAPAPAATGFQAAIAVDAEDRQWLVQVPTTPTAGATSEAEIALLGAIAPLVEQGILPFVVPRAAGFAPLLEGGRAVVFRRIVGSALNLDRLQPGPGAAASLGRAIAAIHELPRMIVEDTGHPSYTADEYRKRHLAQLDEAATTGRIPAFLLRRWETALENAALWRFTPVVTHGELSPESVIMAHGQVSAIVDWTGVQIADPADDLAWLIASAPQDCTESIIEAYQLRRTELLDPHLLDRAQLLTELALVKWLQHGVRLNNPVIIADAVEMMSDLVEVTTETGSFTISSRVAQDGYLRPMADPDSLISTEATDDQEAAQHSQAPAESGALAISDGPEAADLDPASAEFGQREVNLAHSGENPQFPEPKLPNYDRSVPPGPHADDPTTALQVIPPTDDTED